MAHPLSDRFGGRVERIYDVCAFEELLGVVVEVLLKQLLLVPLEVIQQYPRNGRGELWMQTKSGNKAKMSVDGVHRFRDSETER